MIVKGSWHFESLCQEWGSSQSNGYTDSGLSASELQGSMAEARGLKRTGLQASASAHFRVGKPRGTRTVLGPDNG